ncbi:hypothetical protein TRVA0_006S02256 [Trichomonascus vanleenenianus]|uniref:uncharacterized protein n=1 Tax=Trichomonascus vanleenenianus TaxID=2268995 RepID=UPI003EC98B8B
MIRANKENHVGFSGVPKTPLQSKSANVRYKTPMNTTKKSSSLFVTPTNNTRVPLGGKDTNLPGLIAAATTRKGGLETSKKASLTFKRPSTAKRQPLSGALQSSSASRKLSLHNGQKNGIAPAAPADVEIDFGELEVEYMPPPREKPADLPLDHIEMDYEAISRAIVSNLHDQPTASVPLLEHPIHDLLDGLDQEITDTIPVTQSTQKPMHRRQASRFMAPTKSQQAKQRKPVAPSSHIARTSSIRVARDPPPPVDVKVDITEEILLDF